jgi:SAM-dependent methyltransferase
VIWKVRSQLRSNALSKKRKTLPVPENGTPGSCNCCATPIRGASKSSPPAALERDCLRIVDHHLLHLVPRVARYMGSDVHRVLDFGCGSGGSAIALALAYPDVTCIGIDINPREVAIAEQRARLYEVASRCTFYCFAPGQPLPYQDGAFDLCLCSSVLEYVVDMKLRGFCIREMTRLLGPGGRLFCSVPNRLYPLEIHTRRWGWNYFPKLMRAQTVDCTAWEVKRMARPVMLKLYRTPWLELFGPGQIFVYDAKPTRLPPIALTQPLLRRVEP